MKIRPESILPLDLQFQPAALFNRGSVAATIAPGNTVPLALGCERENGSVSHFKTIVRPVAAMQLQHADYEIGGFATTNRVGSGVWKPLFMP